MDLASIFFWKSKGAQDNAWHPIAGHGTPNLAPNAPLWYRRTDLEATVVDVAPFVAGMGGLAHMRQLTNLGLGAHWSIFRNSVTMTAMHRTVLVLAPAVLTCQALNVEYRYAIPRWAHSRERRRDDSYVRTQVGYGMLAGIAVYSARMLLFRAGTRYWAPLEVVMGGALADLMDREYRKAHGF